MSLKAINILIHLGSMLNKLPNFQSKVKKNLGVSIYFFLLQKLGWTCLVFDFNNSHVQRAMCSFKAFRHF